MEGVERVFIVTDPGMVQFKYVDVVIEHLKNVAMTYLTKYLLTLNQII